MERVKKYLRIFLGVPAVLISFLFIGKVFADNSNEILKAINDTNPLLLITGLFFYTSFFALKAYIWTLILKKRGFESGGRKTIYLYSISEIKRYIPGGIFAVFGRMESHASHIPKKETLKGIGIEALLLVLSAVVVSFPALLFALNQSFENQRPLISVLLLILAGISVVLLIRYKSLILGYFNLFMLFTAAWLLYAIGCLFTALSLSFLPPAQILLIISSFTASWLAGYLAFITPMGLGVREVTATYFLTFFVPVPIASVIAVMTRLTMIVGEIVFLAITGSIVRIHNSSRLLKVDFYLLITIAFAIFYFFGMSTLSFIKHSALLTGRFDLGNMSQTVWNTANGNFFMLTNPDGVEIVSRLAVHSDFILILFTPFYFLWSDPRMLLLIQSLVLASGGIFVYLLAQAVIKNRNLALALSASYYLNFWLHEQNLFDFHAVSLATTFLIASFYFLVKRNYLWLSVFLFLAVMTKENIFLIVPFFGFWFYFKEKKKAVGLILTAMSLAVFFFLSSYAIPQARGEEHFVIDNYSYLGDTPHEVVLNTLTRPGVVIGQIFNSSTLTYIHEHLLPLGYLPILSPVILLAVIPEMAIYLLSSNFQYRSHEYHFGAVIIPFLFLSAVYSVKFLLSQKRITVHPITITYYILFFAIASCYLNSPVTGMKHGDTVLFARDKAVNIREYLTFIPDNATVASSNSLGAHLSHREYIFVLPYGLDRADYIAVLNEPVYLESVDRLRYDSLIEDPNNNFYLFKRKLTIACISCNP